MGYIPQQALYNLKKYSYKGVDHSIVSRYILNPFWNWFVTLWPLWVAPNVITLTGLSLVFCNFATLLYYDPGYLTEKDGAGAITVGPPQWVYFTWAVGLFLYQTLDAIDGKQARRTGMAGPLGEMFDHGCDAMNTTLEVILASRALNLGRSWWTVASQIATLANFYLTTWEEYHTGQLYLGVFSGPVEGILMIVVIYMVSGVYGPAFWDTPILSVLPGFITRAPPIAPLLQYVPKNLGLNDAFMIFGGLALAFNILTSYINVYRSRAAIQGARFRPLLFLLPFPTSVALNLLWLSTPSIHESSIVYSSLFVPFLCAWGLQFARQVGKMILAHVTSQPFPWWDWMWVWCAVGAADVNLPRILGRPPIIQKDPKSLQCFVYATVALSGLLYARFCILVIREITNFLGIACFTVRKRDEEGVWRRRGKSTGNEKRM
ncbi:Choline/ethanolaminephosphotransferase [Gloeophyllum trabeum ATCC 11539]|uniref:diacylglycerol cholinephosphotransferase n=1 Tax=Gloeophyllum trabeum (strain ATCC 11539 / FP-39264 / Madison 617) TaxID=670483 RepID=S7QK29_GLOTA|nr:Choline/ethanolaminephosphotransferase [Gloeophyllum trabeum ATCC 11539]EPQ60086.1 Choline/ethanolaminephosphotransferase [Gloeophyllum trabeum ATCC 11539]